MDYQTTFCAPLSAMFVRKRIPCFLLNFYQFCTLDIKNVEIVILIFEFSSDLLLVNLFSDNRGFCTMTSDIIQEVIQYLLRLSQ